MSDQHVRHATEDGTANRPLRSGVTILSRNHVASAAPPHRRKFLAFTALLVCVAVGAVTLTITMLADGSNSSSGRPWSDWSPLDGGTQGATEIANHIAPLYRLSGVDQLAIVTVVSLGNSSANPTTGALSGLQVAVQTSGSGSTGGLSLLSGKTIAYNLCGIGSNDCSIKVGKPSPDRLLLLKREALELALYTFKYIGGTDNVVALLPPGHTIENTLTAKPQSKPHSKPVHLALLFEHQELQPFLDQPLEANLARLPPLMSQMGLWKQTTEAALVAQITERGQFSEQLEQAQDGTHVLVLSQLPS